MSGTTIHRGVENEPYFVVSRTLAQDSRISFEVRGLLQYLLSKPSNWTVNVKDLCAEGGIGRGKAYRLLNEAIDAGYIVRVEHRSEDGKFCGTQLHVFGTPQEVTPNAEIPDAENRHPVNEDTYNKAFKNATEKQESGTGAPLEFGKLQQPNGHEHRRLGQRNKRPAPEHMRIAKAAGIEPREMTRIVNAVLDATGNRAVADTDTDLGGRELSKAQECAQTLLQMGLRTAAEVESANRHFLDSHPTWTPSHTQLAKAAADILSLKKLAADTPKRMVKIVNGVAVTVEVDA